MSDTGFNKKMRSSNMVLNAIFGIVSYLIIIATSFALRKVFADILGDVYLGLNSLFSNIISMLSLTELGIGTAIVFFLYKPIANQDKEQIKTYMNFYKNAYRLIALIVLVIGSILLIFLPAIIKDNPIVVSELRFYFILYVLNSSFSYLLAYKKSMLYADQRTRVTSVSHMLTRVFMYIMQLIVLVIWHSFLGYIIVMMVATFLDNVVCSIFVNKNYSFLKEKNVIKLTKEQKKEIYSKIWPLMVQNLSVFLVDSIDNIIISAFIGIDVVGRYSNYTLVISTLTTVYYQIFSAFSASFGNLAVSEETEYCERIYKNISFLSFWVTTVFTFCYISLIQPFIKLMFGDSFLLEINVPICLTISFAINAISTPGSAAQNSLGLHRKDVWFLVAQGIFNLVFSLVLVKHLGVVGVIVGTIMSKTLTTLYSKEWVLYKYFYKKSVLPCLIRKFMYMLIITLLCVSGFALFDIAWVGNSIGEFIGKTLISFILINVVLISTTFWTDSFKYYLGFAKRLLKRRRY